MEFMKPHRKVARPVSLQVDMERVLKLAPEMVKLCHARHGLYANAMAVAHPQVESKTPLRFFVTADGTIIINPVIVRHTKTTVDSLEGCMSYPDKPKIVVQRWHKIEVEAHLWFCGDKRPPEIFPNQLGTEARWLSLSGKEGYMYQHEIDHLDGRSIFDEQTKNN